MVAGARLAAGRRLRRRRGAARPARRGAELALHRGARRQGRQEPHPLRLPARRSAGRGRPARSRSGRGTSTSVRATSRGWCWPIPRATSSASWRPTTDRQATEAPGRSAPSMPTPRLRCQDGRVRRLWSLVVCVGVLAACTAPTPQPPAAADAADGLELLELRHPADRADRRADHRRDGVVGHARRRLPLRQPRRRWAAPTRDADGNLRADPDRFPHGIAALARYAHDRGMSSGIYHSPFNQGCGQDPRIGGGRSRRADAQRVRRLGRRLPQVRLVPAARPATTSR